tara:strand:- start:80 stop:406 length:327 start_codon:yes stop_codon:yes gene_type:complete
MEVLVEEQGDLYCVCVKVEPYNPREKRKTIVNTDAVKRKLIEMDLPVGAVVQESYIHNLNGVTQGTWFFKKEKVDIPVEPAIIEEEKVVKPKRTRRTRSSTKKVSTEE